MMEINPLFKKFQEFWTDVLSDPEKLAEMQTKYWHESLNYFQTMPNMFDKRFQNELWEGNSYYKNIKNWYLFNANYLRTFISENIENKHLDPKFAHQLKFMTENWINALSPSNFIFSNPEILKEILETGGANLQKGFENFLEDMKRHKISMTDMGAFEVGKNVAITPGKVIYQNDLIQLIQYLPTTEKVHEIPLLIIPPWINKYYIFDLTPEHSFVKWVVDKGFTVYMISWVNPDKRHAEKSFDNYMKEGLLDAISQIKSKQINALGFCIGGTLLAATLAYLTAKKNTAINSATYLATLLDFSDPGDLGVFIDEAQISALEKTMEKTGFLDGGYMSSTFNLLRSNNLIWSYVVNNYLKGKTPAPFDILYWNADSTNMPYKMHSQYLREMYLHNALSKPGGMTLCGVPIDLGKVKIPTYCLATQQDHIAPCKAVEKSMALLNSPIRYVLGESGHIAGIINPPSAKKYGYWIDNVYHADSWWNDWITWLKDHSGSEILPATIENAIEDAPGSYVKVRL